MVKNKSGITLVALIITIIILLIIIGVGITVGRFQINNIKLKAFYTKLEIATEAVEKIAATNDYYLNSSGLPVYYKDLGSTPTAEQNTLILSISNNYDTTKFRYFTADELESILNISGVDLNLLIDFTNKVVISADGEEIDGTTYYVLNNKKESIDYHPENNNATLAFGNFVVSKYGSDSYKIKVTILNEGNVKNGTLKYRKYNVNDYWKVVSSNEIIVSKLGNYEINYTDNFGNIVQEVIKIQEDVNENVSYTIIQ